MSQIESDPERIRLFAAQLKSFADYVQEGLGRVKVQVGRLGETWRDQEFEAFQGEFSRTYLLLNRFAEAANRTAPLLLRDAEALDDFLRVR